MVVDVVRDGSSVVSFVTVRMLFRSCRLAVLFCVDNSLVRERRGCLVGRIDQARAGKRGYSWFVGGEERSLVLKERRVGDGVGCVDSSPGWERRGCLLRTVFATVRVRCSKTRNEW